MSERLRLAGVAALLVVGVVHVQQYLDGLADVPTIGVLFVLNALGAAAAVVMLALRPRTLGALTGIAVAGGAIVSVLLALAGRGLFNYDEPDLRAAVVVALVSEIAAVLALGLWLLRDHARTRSHA